MKKIILLSIAIAMVNTITLAQINLNYKTALFVSFSDFKNNNVSKVDSFIIKKRSKSEIFMDGMGDYKIVFAGISPSKYFLKDSISCVVYDSILYFNNKMGFTGTFSKVEKIGKVFIYLTAPLIGVKKNEVDGNIESGIGTLSNIGPCIIEIKSGNIFGLNEEGIFKLLYTNHKDLYNEYRNTKDRFSASVVFPIIEKYEQRISEKD